MFKFSVDPQTRIHFLTSARGMLHTQLQETVYRCDTLLKPGVKFAGLAPVMTFHTLPNRPTIATSKSVNDFS
jgi:hypothetical protein